MRPSARWRKQHAGRLVSTGVLLLAGTVFLCVFFSGATYRTLPQQSTGDGVDAVTALRAALDDARDDPMEFWVHRYLQWHERQRNNAKRAAVFLPVAAGLGDNVKGMHNLWGYAVLTGRVLLLDVSQPCPLADVIGGEAQRFVFQHGVDNRIGSWVGSNVYLSPNRPLPHNVSKALRGPTPVVSLAISVSTNPQKVAQKLGYEGVVPPFTLEVRRAITKLLLQPNRAIRERKAELEARFGLCPAGTRCSPGRTEYVAVHARLGGVGESHMKRFIGMEEKYDKVAECFARNISASAASNPDEALKVYVATDVPKFRGIFSAAMKDEMPNAVVRHMDAHVAHFARSSDMRAQQDLQVENLLVAGARRIFAFRSGFATVAYWRGNATQFTRMGHRFCGVPGF